MLTALIYVQSVGTIRAVYITTDDGERWTDHYRDKDQLLAALDEYGVAAADTLMSMRDAKILEVGS